MTATETTTTAVARRDNGPRDLINHYRDDFALVLPSHIKAATWVRVAQGALKKGRKQGDYFELEIAAMNNPASFLSALLDAARQGLEPGTEEYYLTPRKVNGKLEILGMRGYQGEIELIYRAGAVSSVVAEVVHQNDVFSYRPGKDRVPNHEIDWDSPDRGPLRLVYAYCVMKDGAISKVVVLNKAAITRIKSFAQGTESKYSPWNTSEIAMWLKSAVHQLQKWVPTSNEYIKEQYRAQAEALGGDVPAPLQSQIDHPDVDPNRSGDVIDPEVVDGEIVHDPTEADFANWNAE